MTKTFKKSVAFLSAAVMVMAMLLYFPSGTFNIDFGLKASAEEITPSQPTDGDGTSTNPYKIGTTAELYWFAGLVNGTLDGVTQNTAAWAKLTANITVNNNVLVDGALNTTNSGSFTSWTPIGCSKYPGSTAGYQYTGTFNGNGKTISGLYFDDGNTNYVGLFGYVGSGGNVSNVGIVDSYFNGKWHVGGVCGKNKGTIQNCYNTGAVSGSKYVGGVCGNNEGTIKNCYNTGAVNGGSYVGGVCGNNYNITIQNCYSTGTVSGWSNIGGVCGYNDGSTITNCYFDSDNYGGGAVGHIYSGTITNVEGKTTTQFESGEVCYLLQSGQENDSESGKAPMVWGQTIGTDKAPVLTSDSKKTVYLIGVTYSNTNSEITNYEAPELNGNVYEITNASQLYWFAEYVKRGNTSAEAILKNNIVVNENVLVENGNLVGDTSNFVSWTPIGNSLKQYTGTFNGNGKTISGLYFDDSGTDCVGLFGYVGSSGNVSNVGVVASYFKGKNNVGGVCGYNYGTIQNCYNTGVVSGSDNVGGVCGNNNGTIKNCYNTGVVSGSDNVGGVCGYNNGGTITNCYFDSNNYGGGAVGSTDGGTITDVEGKTTNAFEKGEVCYLLQGGQENDSESEEAPKVWGQTIGTDKAPVLTSDSAKTVYRKTTGCATYSNTKSEITEKEHSNLGADFRCTDCGNYVAPELNKDVYEISNVSQLYWFAEYVKNGNTSAKAILKENIVVNENVLGADGKLVSDTSKFVSWTPIGSVSNKYTGTFDGNGKKISGLYFDNGGTKYVGLFGYVGSGGNVSNVGVVASYFNGSDDVGGVCGYNSGGTITNCYNTGAVNGSEDVGGVCGYNSGGTITNCYNTGAVNGSSYVGGVCGYNSRGTITNCYNTGAVNGSSYVGGVCGWNSRGTIENCYNTGAVNGSSYVGGVCGYNFIVTIKNCYYLTGTATGGINGTDDEANNVLVKTTTQFTFGEVCYLLNNGTTDGTQVWYQTINSDSYPLLDNSHRTVYACTPCTGVFSNTSGQHADHTYIVDTENGKQHKCEKCGETHNAVFTANDETNTISVCCDLGTVTLKAPTENLTYDGKEKAATVTGVIEGFDTPKILYKLKDSEAAAVETAPVNAGTYVASITYTDADYNEHSVSVEYTIEKAELTVSAGTYKVSKIYDGTKNAGTGSGTLSVSGIINDDDVTVKVDSVGEYSASDVGNDYKVAVAISLSGDKADNYTLGTVSSINVPAAITKAEQTADVIDLVVEKFDCCSVTLAKVDGYEYSMDGETWQDSNVFIGLTAGTKYTFYQRIKATANYEASANSTGVLQTTAEHDYSAENAKPEALYKKATCTSPAVYYYSCSKCGDVEEDSTHTFTNGSVLDHNDTDNDNRCDTCGHIMDGIGAKLAGYSLSLSGNIGVNFYMELSDEVVADETAYMQFTLPNGEKPQVKVSEAEKVTLDNKEYYVFTCEVAAKEMDNTITAQIITSDGEGVAYKYTVRDYADYILDEANGYDDNTKAVVSAMLSYGDYAKAYFSGEELTATSEINAVTSDMLAGYAMTESGILPEGIEYYGSTLLLESETTIRHYFKVTEGTDISAYNMTEKGGYYYIQCSDIPAGSLGTAQDISVGEYTISYSPMSYAYAALNSDSTSDNLKNLVKALYIYYQNAYAYNNSNANAA